MTKFNQEPSPGAPDPRSNGDSRGRLSTDEHELQATWAGAAPRERSTVDRSIAPTSLKQAQRLISQLEAELRHTEAQLEASRRARDEVTTTTTTTTSSTKVRSAAEAPTTAVPQVKPSTAGSASGDGEAHRQTDDTSKHDDQLEALVLNLRKLLTIRAVQIRHLTSELIHSEQIERQRIAQILHDDLQQLLYACQIRMSTLSREVPARQATRVQQVNQLIVRALEVTRTLTADVSPAVVQGDDINAVVKSVCHRMKELHNLKVEIISFGPLHLHADVQTLVYQILDELLFNVVKHAGVDRARVQLSRDADYLVLRVTDEGEGFDAEAQRMKEASARGGFGLQNVHRRLNYLGGRLERNSAPGKGSSASVFVPLTDANAWTEVANVPGARTNGRAG